MPDTAKVTRFASAARLPLLATLFFPLVAEGGPSLVGPERTLPPPCLPGWCAQEVAPGLGWGVRMAEEVTSFDSVWVESVLENWADTPVLFHPDTKVGPSVVLTPKGKPAQARSILGKPGPQWLAYQRKSLPNESLHSFRIDLRAFFGKLPAGTYQVQFVFPAEGYRLQGPGFKTQELKSPVRTLRVSTTSLEDASAHAKAARDVVAIKRDGKPADEKDAPRATLSNGFYFGVLIPVVPPSGESPEKSKPPFRLRLDYQRWHPRHGWYFPRRLPEDGKGSGLWLHALHRGKSVPVLLPDADLDGDGLYRYAFKAYDMETRGAGFIGYGYSEPFVVDRVRAPADPSKKP